MNNLPIELQRLILTQINNNANRASIRAVSKEFKHIIDEDAPITDQTRYTTIHTLGLDKTLSLFLRRSVAAHRKKKLVKQIRTWLAEDKVTFMRHVRFFIHRLHGRKHKKLLTALLGQDYSPSSEKLHVMDAIRAYVDFFIEEKFT